MGFQVKPFVISLTILVAFFITLLSAWNAVTGFAGQFMALYHELHPNPFFADRITATTLDLVLGVGLDFVYAVTDSVIFSLSFSGLYGFFYRSDTNEQ